jgi:hypothetical protein
MKRAIHAALLLGGILIMSLAGRGDEPKKSEPPKPDKQKLRALMMKKLDAAQQLLAAVTKRDHKSVQKNAEILAEITKDPAWKAMSSEEYQTLTDDYRRNAEQLAKNAKDENYDGASLTYVSLTMSCLNCHKYMRDFK